MKTSFKAACIQMCSTRDPQENMDTVAALVGQAASAGADLIMTPEMTNIIDRSKAAVAAAVHEEADCPSVAGFSSLAKEHKRHILAGSLAVKTKDSKLANRSMLFGPDGETIARYDKGHMFDVDLPGGESYRESATYAPGEVAVVADLPWGRLGMTVCYDVRFPYLYRMLAKAGCKFLTVPSAFTVPTGEAHWHVLLRARAIETGAFVFAPAQVGEHEGGRTTYGHSLIVSPWGEVLADGAEGVNSVVMAEVDTGLVDEARGRIPSLQHDRPVSLSGLSAKAAAE